MPVARPESSESRVIAHLDLDCFYVQVEQRERPELRGKPAAVVQYNPWKGGGLIAVSYEARRCGVTRNMRGDDAKKICPDIELVQVPMAHGHAFLSPYRDAGSEVVAVLSREGVCERASIDEVYLDITEAAAARLLNDPPLAVESLSEEACKTHVLGLQEDGEEAMTSGEWICWKDASRDDQLLACGALIVAELRTAVQKETQFTCSAGIAHNKMLAKLTSSMHKPAQQTVIPSSFVPTLLASLPLKKIGQLGGKLGKALEEDLGVKTPGDLLPFSELKLQELYGLNTGIWLWNIARGKNGDEVRARVLPKSHSCGKTFAGPQALKDMTSVMHWLGEMCGELQERLDTDLEMNNRTARLLVFHAACQLRGGGQPAKKFPSKSCPLRYGKEKIFSDARALFERGLRDFCPPNQSLSPVKGDGSNTCNWAITGLSIGASGISAVPLGVNPITSFFAAPVRSSSPVTKSSPSASPTTSPARTFGSFTDVDFQQRLADVEGTCQSSEALAEGSSTLKSSSSRNEEIDGCIQQLESSRDPDKEESGCTIAHHNSEEISSRRNLMGSLDAEGNTVQQNEAPISTPTFGRLGDPVPPLGHFQIHDVECVDYPGKGTADENNGSVIQCERLEATIIRCSPVAGSIPLTSHNRHFGRHGEGESLVCSDGSSSMEMDRKETVDDVAGGRSKRNFNYERPEQPRHAKIEGDAKLKATRSLQARLSFPHANRPQVTGSSGAGDPASSEQRSSAGWETGGLTPEHMLSSTEQGSIYEAGGVPVENHLFVDGFSSIQMDRSGRVSFSEEDARDVDIFANANAGQKASRIVQSCLPFSLSSALQSSHSPSGPSDASAEGMHLGASKMTGSAKLKDFWQQNTVTQTQSSKRTQSHWEYKQEEIDEEVLSQLPLEIQRELRESWKVNRSRPAKRPIISDFFPSFK